MNFELLFDRLISGEEKLSLTGLGYVGLPIAVSFSRSIKVIGFDVNAKKIELYKKGIDPTNEVGDEAVSKCGVDFTANETRLREARFHIVAVPTPINPDKTPNLTPLEEASRTLGRNLTKGSVVVYESTVYPGVTEDICLPILEAESGLKGGTDFKIGYSPERINPGDETHRLENIVKIVSGTDEKTTLLIKKVYELVVEAGIHCAPTIRVAEAAKVIENSQRDINIAFMNELSLIFHKMGIDTHDVLEAAATKWNFLPFTPGLVGGHCIGVDPYYLTYIADQLGYQSQIILAGRRINDSMGHYVASSLVKTIAKINTPLEKARVAVLGITFKENCPDIRNSRVIDVIDELKDYGIEPLVADPLANAEETGREYGITLCGEEELRDLDAVIFAVAHNEFAGMSPERVNALFKNKPNDEKLIFDVKGIFNREEFEKAGFIYWRL